jgi:predicted dehydrogenase
MKSIENMRLGLIGLSEGNGHPYSWAAIFNGYDPRVMSSCPYPVIPAYLARQTFPDDAIPGASVTHVWAQDRAIAEHVAAAALIPHVVDEYEAMIGEVDAVLLARDDAENHLAMSIPFLDAGLPVYIDKPVALTLEHLEALYEHQRYSGQIFSCSAMRFAEEFQLDDEDRGRLGQITHVQATTPKSWEKYGVHIVDPVLNMLGLYGRDCQVRSSRLSGVTVVSVDWGCPSATFTCLGPIAGDTRIGVFGSLGSRELVFRNTFAAFKRTLEAFVDGVRSKREITPENELARVVFILQRGMQDGNG